MSPTRVRVRRRSTRTKRRRRVALALKWTRWSLFVLAVAFVLDGAYTAWKLSTTLTELPSAVSNGRDALAGNQLDQAEGHFSQLAGIADDFTSATRHPSFGIVGFLPGFQDDIEGLRALSRATELSTEAGLSGIEAARALGVTPAEPMGDLFRGGRVDLDAVRAAQPHLLRAAEGLAEARYALRIEPPDLSVLAGGFDTAQRTLNEAADGALRVNAAFQVLPELLGGEERRSYLLAFQALGEGRATGGVLGSYGTLVANRGRLKLIDFAEATAGFPTELNSEPVKAPAYFQKSYAPQSALVQSQQTNVSPNFPVVADVWLQMHERETGAVRDGVAAMDPVALAMMMRGTDPVIAPDGQTLTSNNVIEALSLESYRFERDADQQRYLEAVVTSFWDNVFEGRFDPKPFLSGLGEAVESQHLKVYSKTDAEQDGLHGAGVSGAPWGDQANVQMVFHNNYGANKLDYYLGREIDTVIRLETPDVMQVATTVALTNGTPTDSPLLEVGPQDGEVSTTDLVLNVLAPTRSDFLSRSINGRQGRPVVYQEGDHPVTFRSLSIPAGETATSKVTYRSPVQRTADEVRFMFVPQPRIRADRLHIELVAPPGYQLDDLTKAGSPQDRFVFDGALEKVMRLRLRLVRT